MITVTPGGTSLSAGGSTRSSVARFAGLLRAEWTKIRSVRSTVWTLILFVVLGVLLITTEYSTGVIRASLLAVPKRLPMLIAKITMFAGIMVVIAEVVSFGCYFVGTLLLHSKVAVSLNDPGVIRAVVGAGLYLAVLGLFSLGIGLLFRHTAGAIATAIGAVFVLPILTQFLPDSWGKHINAYLPEQAGSVVFAAHANSGQLLSAWEGFGVFCLWTVVLLGLGAYLLQRRDAS